MNISLPYSLNAHDPWVKCSGLYFVSYLCSEGHHSVQQTHEGHCVGHADPRCAGNAGLRLCVLPWTTLCSSHDLPLHVSVVFPKTMQKSGFSLTATWQAFLATFMHIKRIYIYIPVICIRLFYICIFLYRGDHKQKFYWGHKEILLPVYKNMSDAMKKHPEVDVLISFASLRSAFDSTMETLQYPQVFTQASK